MIVEATRPYSMVRDRLGRFLRLPDPQELRARLAPKEPRPDFTPKRRRPGEAERSAPWPAAQVIQLNPRGKN